MHPYGGSTPSRVLGQGDDEWNDKLTADAPIWRIVVRVSRLG